MSLEFIKLLKQLHHRLGDIGGTSQRDLHRSDSRFLQTKGVRVLVCNLHVVEGADSSWEARSVVTPRDNHVPCPDPITKVCPSQVGDPPGVHVEAVGKLSGTFRNPASVYINHYRISL
jgi:hypothetical protein